MQIFKNPLARKRWQRFKKRRRAFVSLIALLVLCMIGALAGLICNERPLYLRMNGQHFFPAFRTYPDDVFTGSGLQTRPDYRALAQSAAFTDTPGNRIVFAPVPFGARESLDPADLAYEETLTLALTPTPFVASINVDPELRIVRSTAAGHFFGVTDDDVTGMQLTDAWGIPDAVRRAISARFANTETGELEVEVSGVAGTDRRAILRLSRFSQRRRAPSSVRLRLSQIDNHLAAPVEITFDRDGALRGASAFLDGLKVTPRDTLLELARRQAESGVSSPVFIASAGVRYRATAETNVVRWPYPPVRGHWMGIDAAGHDVLARILYGLRVSLAFGLLLALAAMLVGSTIGAIQGYFGGAVDITGQRLIEIWSALPFLYIMILMGSVFGRSFMLLLICYGLFNWIGISYYIRAEFLRLRHEPFVESAKCLGIPVHKIIYRHVMPNALTPLITFFPFLLVGAIGSLAALDFLGFGLPPLTPSWGDMLRQAQQHAGAWWLILYPSLSLFTVMILCVFIGEGVRDACDPRPLTRLE